MTFCINVVEADQFLMVVVVFGVAAALIEDADVLVALPSGQHNIASKRYFLFGSHGINAAVDVACVVMRYCVSSECRASA